MKASDSSSLTSGTDTQSRKNRAILYLWIALIIAASFLTYIPSLQGDFVVDDEYIIVSNPTAHSTRNVLSAFSKQFLTEESAKDIHYYRPLTVVSFQADYSLFGPNPFAFRLTNLLLYIISALLVFIIAFRLTNNITVAGLSGVFFAVFPSHSESVAWISGRTDILCNLFALASFLAFLAAFEGKHRFNWKSGILCSLLFLCSLLSKEASIVLPVLMIVYAMVFNRKLRRNEILKWAVLIAVPMLIYIVLRKHAAGSAFGSNHTDTLFGGLAQAGIAFVCYLRILFIPAPLKIIYNVFAEKGPFALSAAWLVPAGIAVFAAAKRKAYPLVSFCLLWIIISLLPVVGIIPLNGSIPSHRFAYMASVGSSIVLGWLVWRGLQIKLPCFQSVPVIVTVIASAYILYSMATAITGSRIYTTNLNWAYAIANSDTPLYHGVSGGYFFEAGLYEEAETECEKDVIYQPDNPESLIRLAVVKGWLRKHGQAKILLDRASSMPISDLNATYNLGIGYSFIDDWSGAENAFRKCVQINPQKIEYQQQLANACFTQKKYKETVEVCEYILTLPSARIKDHYNLGLAYKAANMPEKAARKLEYVTAKTQGEFRALAEQHLAELKR